MPIDNKYGRVELPDATFSDIGEDEPVVVFRAKDAMLPELLDFYEWKCRRGGSPAHHLALIEQTRELIYDWQLEHGARQPTSDNWKSAK